VIVEIVLSGLLGSVPSWCVPPCGAQPPDTASFGLLGSPRDEVLREAAAHSVISVAPHRVASQHYYGETQDSGGSLTR